MTKHRHAQKSKFPRVLIGAALAVVLIALAVGALVIRSGGDSRGSSEASNPPDRSTAPSSTAEVPDPGKRPEVGNCYRLTFAQAGALTSEVLPRACNGRHTSATYRVGTMNTISDGHLLAVDSDRVQTSVAQRCTTALSEYLGGDTMAARLTMLRPVWFTPTLEQVNLGEDWFRCDVVALRSEGELLTLANNLRGILATEAAPEEFGLCATARPGEADFSRVACGEPHSWRAISTFDLAPPDTTTPYPGLTQVQDAGQDRCLAAAQDIADDSLDFSWGYEWPTAEQWRAGRRWGTCWAPG